MGELIDLDEEKQKRIALMEQDAVDERDLALGLAQLRALRDYATHRDITNARRVVQAFDLPRTLVARLVAANDAVVPVQSFQQRLANLVVEQVFEFEGSTSRTPKREDYERVAETHAHRPVGVAARHYLGTMQASR
jgi:hypothetical protein